MYGCSAANAPALSLNCQPLQLRSPAVFDYISQHALEGRLAPYVAGGRRNYWQRAVLCCADHSALPLAEALCRFRRRRIALLCILCCLSFLGKHEYIAALCLPVEQADSDDVRATALCLR